MISIWMYDPTITRRDDKEKANELAEMAHMNKTEADIFVQGFMAGLQFAEKRMEGEKDNDSR